MMEEEAKLSPAVRRLTSAALALTLGIAVARCMMPEILRDPFETAPGTELGARGPGAATSVFLNTLSFLPPLLVLLASWVERRFRLVHSWSHFLFGALGLLALASSVWASDAFAAGVTGGNLLAASLLGWTATQTVRSWRRFRLVAGLIVGLLLVLVAHSILYRTIDAPALREMWNAQRDTLLRQHNFEPGGFQAQLFEKKVLGGEILGFFSSANTLAAVAVMGLLLLLGSMLDRRRLGDYAGWMVTDGIVLGGAMWLIVVSGSRAASATAILAIGLLTVWPRLGRWNLARPRRVFWTAVLLVVLGAGLVVAHGLYHGNLMERSLTFRWHYWTAAWRMGMGHVWGGVGWSNFGLWYSSLKLPFAPEDVKDPHNLLVRFASELGIGGAALCLAWLLRSAWEASRPLEGTKDQCNETPTPEMDSDRVFVIVPFAVPSLLATLLVVLFAVDFTQVPEFYVVETLRRLMYGCLLLGGGVLVGLKSIEHPAADERPVPWLLAGALVALAMFLLHNMIDFAFSEAGPMSLALLLLGACVGVRASLREGEEELARPEMRLLILPLLLCGAAYAVIVALPVMRAEALASEADVALSGSNASSAGQKYEEAYAAAAHLRNGDYLLRAARALTLAGQPAQESLTLIDRAIAANPRFLAAWNSKAQLLDALHQDSVPARLRTLELDPVNVGLRLSLADVLAAGGRRVEAVEQYRTALHYNDLLPPGEIRRLPAEREQGVRMKMEQLQEAK